MKLLKDLIAIKSLSGQEEAIAKFILSYCENNGIKANDIKGNIVIHFEGLPEQAGKTRKKAMILCAHLDTVSEGDMKKWNFPPYGAGAGVIKNGKIFGLGASDCKAVIASILLLTKEFKKKLIPEDLWFALVVREEKDGWGAEKFLKWFTSQSQFKEYEHIACIIGEPTGLKTMELGHRGNYFIKLETYGLSGHGAIKYTYNNLAIVKMLEVLQILQKMFKTWENKYKDQFLGLPSLNITGLEADSGSINKIPDKCQAFLDIRTTPGLHEGLPKKLNKIFQQKALFTIIACEKPGIVSDSSLIVNAVKKADPGLKIDVSLGSTDMAQFLTSGIETVVLGPGEKECIHKENEYAYLKKVRQCVKLYKRIIEAYAKETD